MRWEGIWYDVNTKKPEQRPRKWSRKRGDGLKSTKMALEIVAVHQKSQQCARNRCDALEIVAMDWKMWGGARRRRNSLVNVAWGVPNIVS